MKKDVKSWISFALNITIIALAIPGMNMAYSSREGGRNPAVNWSFFTNDSNLLLWLMGLLLLAFQIVKIVKKKEIPDWVKLLYSIASVGTTLTFLTVVFILTPMVGNMTLFYEGNFIYLHTLCPILGFAHTVFFLGLKEANWKKAFLGIIPMAVYVTVVLPLVAVRIVDPPYPFMDVFHNTIPMSILYFAGMFALGYGIAVGTAYLSRLTAHLWK